MKPLQNQYQDLLEGKLSKFNFLNNIKRNLPDLVSNVTSFDDAVKILKSKRILSEVKVLLKENAELEDIIAKYIKDPEDINKEMDAYHHQGYEGFSDMLKANLDRDMDFQSWVQKGHDEETYKKETGYTDEYDEFQQDRERHLPESEDEEDEYNEFQQDRERHLPESLNEDWGSSDQSAFNKAIHKDLGEPKEMPMPFDPRFEAAVESAVDFWWDDWDEYATDREGLIDKAKKLYYRAYFPEKFAGFQKMFSETKEEDDAVVASYDNEQDAKHTLPGGNLREDIDINPKLSSDTDKVNPIEYRNGIDFELDLSGDFSAQGLEKAVKKVLKNLSKDSIYYTNSKANLTQKINKKEIEATKQVEVKKDNHTDELNKLKTLVKKEMANTKNTLSKKEKASSATPKGVKLMKEDEEKFDLNKYNKDNFKKQSKEFTNKLTKPVTQKNTLKDKIKEYVVKQLKKEAIGFTVGGKEQFVKNTDAPSFEQNLKNTGVKYTKRNVQ